ncbi:8-amino-7-oxononanoate synthase [Corynebacterium belfantii]|uniref:aminotransferase class I/II-fold pyridoxal phosphate-dependent enzyme n=2 Tax=Corynebacterium belfantii TaxID=2014537 RepID=UPI0018D312E6|nr:8-amino-7-oxononanoate synthase [Corynebacterium belfantii]MBG9329321.1 8-amino-7-oxononanoate synthase [Corynebacterium belfantii]
MSPSLDFYAHQRNVGWRERGLERTPAQFSSPQTPHAIIDNRPMLLFSSSDYLGLSEHPFLKNAAIEAITSLGTGSGGSRLTTGSSIHRSIEIHLAQFFGSPDAAFFASGYQANVTIISTLAGTDCTIYSDSLNHASIIDGCRLSKSQVKAFPTGDYEVLDDALTHCPTANSLVITDAVFSMSGAIADLGQLRRVAARHGSWLLIDDAHGIGCLGNAGRGTAHLFPHAPTDFSQEVIVGTSSKALGGEGGFALCSEQVATLLRNQGRGYVFSTAPSPATMATTDAALTVLEQEPDRVRRLQSNIAYFAQQSSHVVPVQKNGFFSAIISYPIGDENQALLSARLLRDKGFFIPAIRYPTVSRGNAMLRITMTSMHSHQDIDQLADALKQLDSHRFHEIKNT